MADSNRGADDFRTGSLIRCSLLLAAAWLLSGCGKSEVPASVDSSDELRIVSLAPHLTELVFTAGAGDRLVGVVAYSDYPAEATSLPLVGDAFRVDLETMAVLKPNLILAWQSGNPDEVIGQLREQGYEVMALSALTLADVATSLEAIGARAGTATVADTAAARFREELELLRRQHQSKETIPVFYQVSQRPLYTIGRRHTINEVIELCGGRNIFDTLPGPAPAVSVEDVLLRKPHVIIAGDPPGQEALTAWQEWSLLPAVQEQRLCTVDASLVARASIRILDGARQICRCISPG